MKLCDYGCGQEATHQFKNGKWCCSKNIAQCPSKKNILSKKLKGKEKSKQHKQNISKSSLGRVPWNKGKTGLQVPWNKGLTKVIDVRLNVSKDVKNLTSLRMKKLWSNETSIFRSEKYKSLMVECNYGSKNPNYLTITKIKKRYKTFSKIEEMRYNPDKLNEKEIQVHCKNHNCPNSKEHGGWFTPTKPQFYERVRQVEYGNGGCYFYCCDECKNECPLYNLHSDPFKENDKPYTIGEYQQFREYVLERDNYKCQYCGKPAEHVHHERPQKLEPFFALDPELAWSVCKECHYKYGHKDECSTGNIAKEVCK